MVSTFPTVLVTPAAIVVRIPKLCVTHHALLRFQESTAEVAESVAVAASVEAWVLPLG